jgi:hypothetical protein
MRIRTEKPAIVFFKGLLEPGGPMRIRTEKPAIVFFKGLLEPDQP